MHRGSPDHVPDPVQDRARRTAGSPTAIPRVPRQSRPLGERTPAAPEPRARDRHAKRAKLPTPVGAPPGAACSDPEHRSRADGRLASRRARRRPTQRPCRSAPIRSSTRRHRAQGGVRRCRAPGQEPGRSPGRDPVRDDHAHRITCGASRPAAELTRHAVGRRQRSCLDLKDDRPATREHNTERRTLCGS